MRCWHDVTTHGDESDDEGWKGGERGGSLFITGPPATFLLYRPNCSIRAGGSRRANLLSDKCTVLLGPLKLAQLKPEFGTEHPESHLRLEELERGEERTTNKKTVYQLITHTV
jgi:hypothetical protein